MKVFLNLLAESPCPKALAKLTCNFIPTCDFIPSFHFHRSFGMKLQKLDEKDLVKKRNKDDRRGRERLMALTNSPN